MWVYIHVCVQVCVRIWSVCKDRTHNLVLGAGGCIAISLGLVSPVTRPVFREVEMTCLHKHRQSTPNVCTAGWALFVMSPFVST